MKRRDFIHSTAMTMALPLVSVADLKTNALSMKRKLLVFGSGNFTAFLKHIIPFTQKENPKICFIPTATGDSLTSITNWYSACEGLPLQPFVLKTFISSYNTKKSFEETILEMDAIFVGGGNTLNMLAIWRAQGIDASLRKAYDKGVLMTGGSAGSLCWFESGTTDSRPIELSKVDCMGWIKGSHCPHFDGEEFRRPLYHDLIKKGELPPGYACDNQAGIYFEDEKFIKSVALNDMSFSYYVDVAAGKATEKKLSTEILK
ncbi:MAG TPA: peptidase E [Cyclobacteriaceae bacterium]